MAFTRMTLRPTLATRSLVLVSPGVLLVPSGRDASASERNAGVATAPGGFE